MKEWWTAAELAELNLPGLPSTKRSINRLAADDNWRDPAREFPANPNGTWRASAEGDGFEYRYDCLPLLARSQLAMRTQQAEQVDAREVAKSELDRAEMWRAFERLPDSKKQQAREKLGVLQAVADLEAAGTQRDVAVTIVGRDTGNSVRTIYRWQSDVHGVDRADWLPYLAPRRAGRQVTADCSPDAWEWFKANYLRQSQPTAAQCYRQLEVAAAENNWTIPSRKTLERRIAALDVTTRTFLRKGGEALKRLYPAQERDRSNLHALEAVNADGHKFDVFVEFPDGEITRPVMVAFQDLYSGMMLSWRVDKTENKEAVRLAFGDMVENYGIPDVVVLDNGRNFASKWITGGSPTRYRFKVKDEEPEGIITALGAKIHWTTPYSGQSKPIERAFRDFAGNISRDVRFEGAWTGNTIAAKPENYGTRAVKLETFIEVLSQGVIEHNTRAGRRTRVCGGRLSFSQAFEASYAVAPIRQALPEQRRMWLLASELVSARVPDGSVFLDGNRYWSEFLVNQISRKVVLRFDPQALHDGVHVYRPDSSYLGHAQCVEAVGFHDTDAARNHARARRAYIKNMKAAALAERKMSPEEIAAMMPQLEEPAPVETKIVRPFFGRIGNTALAIDEANQPDRDTEHDQENVLTDFNRAMKKFRAVSSPDGAGE